MSEQEVLQSLRKAIEQDKNYFVKAKIDKNLDPIRSQVDKLLEEIEHEAKTKAERGISRAKPMVNRMVEWFNSEFCDGDADSKFSSAWNKIQKAKRKFGRDTYFDYLAALKVMKGVIEDLEYVQESIRDDLEYSKKRLEECNSELEDIHRNRLFSFILLCSGIIAFLIGLLLMLDHIGVLIAFIIFSIISTSIWATDMAEEIKSLTSLIFWSIIGVILLFSISGFIIGFFAEIIANIEPSDIEIIGSLLVFYGPFIAIKVVHFNYPNLKYSESEQKEAEEEIESLKQRISVAEKSIVPLTAKG